MEQLVTQILTEASGAGAYSLVLIVLLLCGLGIPLPEDVALITGGFLVFKGAARLEVMIVVAFLGILGGDSCAFFLGRRLGDGLVRRWPFRHIITPSKRSKVERLFARYGEKIVVAARFMPGVRAVTYFCAGTARMRYSRFIAFDGLAATVSAPVFVMLGWKFGDKIDRLIKAVRRGQSAVVVGAIVIIGAALLARYLRRRIAHRESVEPAPSTLPPEVAPRRDAAPRTVVSRHNGEARAAK